MAVLDVTNRCNMKCTYCNRFKKSDIEKGYQEPSVYEINQIYHDVEKNGIMHLALQGGEPFLRQDIIYIIESIGKHKKSSQINLKKEWMTLVNKQMSHDRFMISSYLLLKKICFPIMSITSNGTIYSDKLRQCLYNNNFHLEISIDSVNEKYHSQYRIGAEKNYYQIISNIKKYSEELAVILKTTVYEDNVKSMADMIGLAYDLGCIHVVFTPLIASGRAKGAKSNWISDYVKQVNRIIEMGCEKRLPVIVEIVFSAMYLTSEEEYYNMRKKVKQASNIILSFHTCKAYQDVNEIYISSNLDVYGCPQLLYMEGGNIGSLKRNEISVLWERQQRKILQSIIEKRSQLVQCRNCILLEHCRAGCIANSKCFNNTFDYFCQFHH